MRTGGRYLRDIDGTIRPAAGAPAPPAPRAGVVSGRRAGDGLRKRKTTAAASKTRPRQQEE